MGWLITLAVIVLLAILPFGVRAVYDENGAFIWLLFGPFKLRLYPAKPKRNKKEKVKKEEKKKESASKSVKKEPKQKGGSYNDFLPLIRTILQFLDHFRRKLRVNHLEMRLILAGGDPDTLAVNYGKAWTALGNLMPHLERFLVIRKRHLEVECDFVEESTRIFARADITITIARVFHLLGVHGIRILKHLFQLKNLQKGGVKNESKPS